MRKLTFPLSLLVLFGFFVSLRGQGDRYVQLIAAAVNPAEMISPIDVVLDTSGVGLAAMTGDQLAVAGLLNDYLAVFGILVASVILALRRRAHLVFGQRHRRR